MRCKCCDEIMKESEIIWDDKLKMHEELCSKCLKIVRGFEEEITSVVSDEGITTIRGLVDDET